MCRIPRGLRFLFRIGVSAGLLAILLASVDTEGLLRAFRLVHWMTLAGCLLAILAGVGLSAYRWQGFLHTSGIRAGLGRLSQLCLIGLFFNNFLPTAVGGDLVRAGLLCRDREPPAEVVASVLAERLSGLAIVCLYGVGGVFFLPRLVETFRTPLVSLGVIVIVSCVFFSVSRIRQKLKKVLAARLGEMVGRFFSCFGSYLRHPGVLARAVWTSMVFQLLVVLTYWLVARDISVGIGFVPMLVVVFIVTLLTVIPVSINGIGVREGGFVFMLGRLGIEKSAALALSLTVYAMVLGVSLLGGLAFFLWRRQESVPISEA